jgi:hypothetical protein
MWDWLEAWRKAGDDGPDGTRGDHGYYTVVACINSVEPDLPVSNGIS